MVIIEPLYLPTTLVVVRNRDADEAGDYRVMVAPGRYRRSAMGDHARHGPQRSRLALIDRQEKV